MQEEKKNKITRPCMVCYEENSMLAFCQPCGHYGLCGECLEKIIRSDPKCPICRCELV